MIYAIRDEDGAITSVHRDPVPGGIPLEDGHPDVLAFVDGDEHAQAFAGLDADLVRVLEDLIDALINRNILRITDLPAEAQQKLFERKHFRSRAQAHSLNLFGADGSVNEDGMASVDHSIVDFHND